MKPSFDKLKAQSKLMVELILSFAKLAFTAGQGN
jgi:hypothetical protein